MKETIVDVANAVGGAIDSKSVVAGGIGISGLLMDVKELGVILGEVMPGYVVFATFIYICFGIRNRWKNDDD